MNTGSLALVAATSSLIAGDWNVASISEQLNKETEALYHFIQSGSSASAVESGSLLADVVDPSFSRSGTASLQVIRFIEKECVLTDDFHGKPVKLMPFWREIITDLYDTQYDSDGSVYYQDAILEVPRGCAKTLTIAHLVTYHLHKESNFSIFVCASDKAQAQILFKMVKAQLQCNPWLAKQIGNATTRKGKEALETARFELRNKRKGNTLVVGSSLASNKHGTAPSLVILDEGHAVKDGGALYEAFGTGIHKRKNARIIQISSAGHDRAAFFYTQHQRALKIISGETKEIGVYARVWSLPEHLDYRDPRNWHSANPSLGYTLSLKRLFRQFKTMSGRSFRTFYLNQWFTGDEDGWKVTTDNWNRLADSELQMEDFAGEPCECGYDHAYGNFDSPALVVKFRRGDKRFVFPFIWVTPKTFEHRIKNENAAYDLWREQGLVMLSGTDMVDEQDIVSFIKQLNDRHPITHLTFDRQFKMRSLGKQLDEVLGSSVIIAQDPRAHILFPHMEKFERMVFNNLIVHDGNGLLSWQISNVKMERIGSMANPLPSKKASRLHIDAVMALFYSIACEEVEDSGASFRNMKAYLEKQGGSEGSTDEDIW